MKQILKRDGPTITLLLVLVLVFTVISSMLGGHAEELQSQRSRAQAEAGSPQLAEAGLPALLSAAHRPAVTVD